MRYTYFNTNDGYYPEAWLQQLLNKKQPTSYRIIVHRDSYFSVMLEWAE